MARQTEQLYYLHGKTYLNVITDAVFRKNLPVQIVYDATHTYTNRIALVFWTNRIELRLIRSQHPPCPTY